jgi:CBS domain-containing protein
VREFREGVVSDHDLLRAAEGGIDGVSAGEVATGDLPTIGVDEPLDSARVNGRARGQTRARR